MNRNPTAHKSSIAWDRGLVGVLYATFLACLVFATSHAITGLNNGLSPSAFSAFLQWSIGGAVSLGLGIWSHRRMS